MKLREEEIRPQKIFDEYLRLAKEDTITYFSDVERVAGSCPACDIAGEYAFDKHGFTYESCPNCQTLFVNPRPIAAAFSKYYTESPSSKYWASTFYKETAAARKEKLWKPKARMVLETLAKYSASDHNLVDIGGGLGLFAEEIRESSSKTVVVIEPGPHLAAACRERSLPVVEKFLEDVQPEDLPNGPMAFVSFELFEHLHDPAKFIRKLQALMTPGDLLIFTTLSGAGVDIQALWENSKSVVPPHHLNFFNPMSVEVLLARLMLEVLEVTTPGKLDLDILMNNHLNIKDRFWRTFISIATGQEKEAWQEFIASSGWSSHMLVVCRKP